MENNINNHLIILVIILLSLTFAASVSYFGTEVVSDGVTPIETNTGNMDLSIDNIFINSDLIKPIYEENYYRDAYKKEFSISNKNSSLNSCTSIYLNINSIDKELVSEYFKFKLFNENEEINSGSFNDIVDHKLLLKDKEYLLSGESKKYTLYLYIDYVEDVDQSNMLNKNIDTALFIIGYDKEDRCE